MNQRINKDECWAEKWLVKQGYQEIRRPRNDPPDFVVDNCYAVEVTRLSQRITWGDSNVSISEEGASIPLRDRMERALRELGPPGNEGHCWTVDCTYDLTTPLPRQKVITAQLRKALEPLLKPYDENTISELHSRHRDFRKHAGEPICLGLPHICLKCGICLDLLEFTGSPSEFILQNVSDGKGIHVAGELRASIRNRIQIKSENIRSRQLIDKYTSWWLLLVDYVYHAPVSKLFEHELSIIRDQEFGFWSRIVVLSSKNLNWHYDLLAISEEQ